MYGVSTDDVASHQAFTRKFGFNFPLLADPDQKICEAFGVQVSEDGCASRVTFLVSKEGTIFKVYPKVKAREHVPEVLAAFGAAPK